MICADEVAGGGSAAIGPSGIGLVTVSSPS